MEIGEVEMSSKDFSSESCTEAFVRNVLLVRYCRMVFLEMGSAMFWERGANLHDSLVDVHTAIVMSCAVPLTRESNYGPGHLVESAAVSTACSALCLAMALRCLNFEQ